MWTRYTCMYVRVCVVIQHFAHHTKNIKPYKLDIQVQIRNILDKSTIILFLNLLDNGKIVGFWCLKSVEKTCFKVKALSLLTIFLLLYSTGISFTIFWEKLVLNQSITSFKFYNCALTTYFSLYVLCTPVLPHTSIVSMYTLPACNASKKI